MSEQPTIVHEVQPAVACGTILGLLLLTPLSVLATWNLGVVGAVHAAHGNINSISIVTAIGLTLAIGLIRGLLRAAAPKTINTTEDK